MIDLLQVGPVWEISIMRNRPALLGQRFVAAETAVSVADAEAKREGSAVAGQGNARFQDGNGDSGHLCECKEVSKEAWRFLRACL